MTPFRFSRFRVTAFGMGSVEFYLGPDQMRWFDECKTDEARKEFLAHEAWREMFKSSAKHMLKRLCEAEGTTKVKRIFEEQIQIEEITT